jgi:ribosomal protein L37AE/L43A
MVAYARQVVTEQVHRHTEALLFRVRAYFGPPCPDCGRKAARPETERSPILQCQACGTRYLNPATGRTSAKRQGM